MKRIVTVVSLMVFLATEAPLLAEILSANVYVYDVDGTTPLSGIMVDLEVSTYYWEHEDGEGDYTYYCQTSGATNSNGNVYLQCDIPSQFYGEVDYMFVNVNSSQYVVIYSQDDYTYFETHLNPVFHIGYDGDGNSIVDIWEMPLAEKFCPVLFQPKDDNGSHWDAPGIDYTLRPVPVEAMDRDGPSGQPDGILTYHDVDVDVYNVRNIQFVGTYNMENILDYAGNPYSNRYPDMIKPYDQISCTPPGKAYSSYTLLPHYEWATTDDHEGNVSWYGEWNDLYYQKGVLENDTWYVDGTMYAMLADEGSSIKLLYAMHFPFNAAANRHEGDWQGIVVELDNQDPGEADIVSVQFHFHGEKTIRTIPVTYSQSTAEALSSEDFWEDGNGNPIFANKYFMIGGTHPVTFGGGKTDYYGVFGWGSHAQYPSPGTWKRDKGAITIEEFVVQNGSISNETLEIDFNNYDNIRILPPRQYIVDNLRSDANYNWAVFGGFWGGVYSFPSAEQSTFPQIANHIFNFIDGILFGDLVDVLPEIPDANIAALSPYKGSIQ